ncbi:hypothetical protein Dimus_009157 [Dionaea muscipula]
MVLQSRLDYGFIGYKVPPIPQAKRSARRGRIKKKIEDHALCAFDLLATVAGKLLLEGGNSTATTLSGEDRAANFQVEIRKENVKDIEDLPKVEHCDQGSAESGFLLKELGWHLPRAACSGGSSTLTAPDSSKVSSCQKILQKNDGTLPSNPPRKFEGSFGYMQPSLCKLEDHVEEQKQCQPLSIGGEASFHAWPALCVSQDPNILDVKPPTLINSDSSGKVSFSKDRYQHDPHSVCRDDLTVVSRDDDENSSGCTQPCTALKPARAPAASCLSDRRTMKFLASKYWRVAPKVKDGDLSDSGGGSLPTYHNRKSIYKRQRSQRIYPLKKRKIFNYSPASSCDGITAFKSTYESPTKAADIASSGSGVNRRGDAGSTASVVGQKASVLAGEPNVKLRIKSFRVPELFFEIPETATVASLKRTVMEAVTMLLGDGLRVGVLFQGKKIRDDNKTLMQTGISHDNKVEALAFTLEPKASQALRPIASESRAPLYNDGPPQPSSKCLPTSSKMQQDVSPLVSADVPLSNVNPVGACAESDHDSAPSPSAAEISTEKKSTVNSRDLVTVAAANAKPLAAVVPIFHQKSNKRSEIGQRRIRRPFSVFEVEALVQAVEKLGTGRWRDVKLRAFDNVKHRTYVDLKDKWKTLVHTARISPQQRRGEPVPQELLDRVLTAHAYWSQHQAKQQLKQQQAEGGLLLSPCLNPRPGPTTTYRS